MAKNGMPDGIKTVLMWGIGIGSLALFLLIMVIIFGNLSGHVGFGQTSTRYLNETITLSDTPTAPASTSGKINPTLSSVVVQNRTVGTVINSPNYTISGIYLTVATATPVNGTSVNVSYTITYDTQGKIDADSLINNYTKSATNTAAMLPTVGTILGVVVLLILLIGVLVYTIRKMMGVASNSTIGRSGSGGGKEPSMAFR